MKKLYLLPVLAFGFSTAIAQTENKPIPKTSVLVKFAPATIFAGKIGFGGEINDGDKSSCTVYAGIPYASSFNWMIDGQKRTLSTKSYSVMAGYRLYLGKKGLQGFYFEPYFKCLDNKTSTQAEYMIGKSTMNFNISSNYHGMGIGAQLGYQFLVAKKISVDWYLLGPEANSCKYELIAHPAGESMAWDETATADAREEFTRFVRDIPVIGNKTSINVNTDQRRVTAEYRGFMPGFRTGISLGFKF